jgi:hypothetical protein
MRAVVGDVLGKFRVLDLWSDNTIARAGGNLSDAPDRAWACGAVCHCSPNSLCFLHDSGSASFFDVIRQARTQILSLTDPAPAAFVRRVNDVFVGCFSGRCVSFSESEPINTFETVECSCATCNDVDAAFGRISERTTVYDITSGQIKWVAAPPPLDELGLALSDNDRSILFAEDNILLVGQNDGFALVYDERASPEAVIRARPFPEFPLTALEKLNDNLVAVGDTIGSLTIVDLRMGESLLKGYRGFQGAPAGNIQICVHPSLTMFAALTCDRIVRLYDYERKLKVAVKAAFTKTMGRCLVLMDDLQPATVDLSDADWEELPEDQDGLWENFIAQARPPPEED